MRQSIFAIAAVSTFLAAGPSRAGITFGQYNLVTSGNVSDQSDVQGRVLVGGTLNTNNFTFGGQLPGTTTNPPAGIFNALAGNVTNLNTNGHNFIFGSGNAVNGVSANPSATSGYTNGLASQLAGLSSAYASLATNSSVNAADRNQISFNATPTMIGGQSVAVFSLDQGFFGSNGTVSSLTGVGPNTTVVVNLTGGVPGNDPLGFASGLNFAAFSNAANEANVIFNFINATSLSGLINLGGSILAANADINTNNTLRGSVYAKSISNVGEIDLPRQSGTPVTGFSGFDPRVIGVPEPSSMVMVGLASLMGIGTFWMRRRRAIA